MWCGRTALAGKISNGLLPIFTRKFCKFMVADRISIALGFLPSGFRLFSPNGTWIYALRFYRKFTNWNSFPVWLYPTVQVIGNITYYLLWTKVLRMFYDRNENKYVRIFSLRYSFQQKVTQDWGNMNCNSRFPSKIGSFVCFIFSYEIFWSELGEILLNRKLHAYLVFIFSLPLSNENWNFKLCTQQFSKKISLSSLLKVAYTSH